MRILWISFGCLALAWAQEDNIRIRRQAAGAVIASEPGTVAFAPQGATFHFVAAEGGFAGRPVKNAPYSGEGVTEFTQTLADGTKIKRQNSSKFARDSEGRTRTEHKIGSLGNWAPAGEAPTVVNITDPVAGVVYLLNEREKSAERIRRMTVEPVEGRVATQARAAWKSKAGEIEEITIERVPFPAGAGVRGALMQSPHAGGRAEALGKQTIEGLVCEGTRMTRTIPAGEIGNDRPLETVVETWYSAEIQAVVMSRNNDPMSGETVYRLTNVRRVEPDRSLFEIPAGYTIKEH